MTLNFANSNHTHALEIQLVQSFMVLSYIWLLLRQAHSIADFRELRTAGTEFIYYVYSYMA